MSFPSTVIIADDLTGALDSIAPFASLGLVSVVATAAESLTQALAQSPDVLAVNLGTREADARTARDKMDAACATLLPSATAGTLWLKKIDSRMKGQIAAEVAGLVAALGATRVLVCPAIPDLGRVVIGGCLQGAGVETPFPVTIDLAGTVPVEAPDARGDDDLDAIVKGARPGTVLVGARGLAMAIARLQRPNRLPAWVTLPHGPAGFCIGSRDPITMAQVDCLRKSGQLSWIAAPDGLVPHAAISGDVLVQATPGTGASGAVVSARLAAGMLPHLSALTSVIASGGETAAALLGAAGIGVLRVMGEVMPGLPLCHAVGRPGFPAIITKSGGFGQPDTLFQLWQAARRTKGQSCP